MRNKNIFTWLEPRMLANVAGCRTMFPFAVSCKIGTIGKRNVYWFHVELVFIVIFGQYFKLDVRA